MPKLATLRLAISASCGLLAVASLAFAQPTTAPTTAPTNPTTATTTTTTQAAVAVDQSTPVAAAKSFFAAVEAGDSDAALSVIANSDERVVRMMRQLATATGAFTELNAATKAAFDQEITDTEGFAAPPASAFEQATVEQTGDTATLTSPEFGAPMHFVRTDGKWYVDLTEQMQTVSAADLDQMEQVVPPIARAYRETAEDVRAGRLASMEEMDQAFAARMQQAMQEMAQLDNSEAEGGEDDGQ